MNFHFRGNYEENSEIHINCTKSGRSDDKDCCPIPLPWPYLIFESNARPKSSILAKSRKLSISTFGEFYAKLIPMFIVISIIIDTDEIKVQQYYESSL